MRTVRIATSRDAAEIAAIYTPFVRETVVTFEEEAPSDAEMEDRIRDGLLMFPWVVLERDGKVGGYAYASLHRARASYRWAADVSCYLAPDCRGQGVGGALYETVFAILRAQNYTEALAGITLPNEASVRMHEKRGFRPIGVYRRIGFKLGAWHDVGWWQCEIQSPESPPPEPIPFASIDDSVRLIACVSGGSLLR